MNTQNLGNLFIISAASGAGKTSLIKAMLAVDNSLQLSVSHTTRQPRPGEKNRVDYHFVTTSEFAEILSAGGFLESALVHGAQYGTSQAAVVQMLENGQDVILEIDWQGAAQIRQVLPQALSIFILPPSLQVLEARLKNRGQDSAEVIAKRLAAAREEMRHVSEFDYVTINDDFEVALQDLRAIIRAQKLKTTIQLQRHQALVTQLT